ncbi:hypothetical protein [Psychromonas sp. MME1]|uniref:hypothetical protein n=1 Tax=Psychromonas sp. MME1 TaxID=3231032 RepID=UPI0034E21A52
MKKLILAVSITLTTLFGCGGGSSTSDDSGGDNGDIPPIKTDNYTLLAWNDLGMHCVDGKDYSVFSILPPYNDLKAQLILKEGNIDKHVTSGVTITYQSAPSLAGDLNTESASKTNFWDYALQLFAVKLNDNIGLAGNMTPSTAPQPLAYNNQHAWWEADGIPIMNYDDNGKKNYYPMVKVVARDVVGNLLATAQVVLPVSDEMDCQQCHASNTHINATPKNGWVNNADPLKDFKLNILRRHDDKHDISHYLQALQANGYHYSSSLYETAIQGTPILCAICHQSNALGTNGFNGIPPLTTALHALHANVTLPKSSLTLNDDNNRDSCYACHPGATTECLRGAMGKAKAPDGSPLIECQSCHGNMSAVGQHGRNGWFDEPDCQSCHQAGMRHTTAVIDDAGTLRPALDKRFATNDNTPLVGSNLYRFSRGHGEMQCSACHGSTHAIYPSSHEEDNLQSIALQGHSGTIAECTVCHATPPWTTNQGPHGMHSIGQRWVDEHKEYAEHNTQSCAECHGADFRGSFLSKTFSARSFMTEEWGDKNFSAGHPISCYDCHNGPYDD